MPKAARPDAPTTGTWGLSGSDPTARPNPARRHYGQLLNRLDAGPEQLILTLPAGGYHHTLSPPWELSRR